MPQRFILFLAVLLLLIQNTAIVAPVYPVVSQVDEVAYFRVGFPTNEVTMMIKLVDVDRIQEARNMLKTGQPTKSVMGKIIKTAAAYNPPWHYQLDPTSIKFFELATEVCDADPTWIEENLSDICNAALPNCVWCPWNSQLLSEVQVKLNYLPLVTKLKRAP